MEQRIRERHILIPMDSFSLPGDLNGPTSAAGVVIFAHGSGSSRFSPRNRFVAAVLQQRNFATLLFDLLSEAEDRVYQQRFDIARLTERLLLATDWVTHDAETQGLPIGYFGASTGAAAALCAAATLGSAVSAVVSRGGRPDMAGERLSAVQAPTMLIVGGADTEVLAMNREALAQLRAVKELAIVPGATHLFEEPGALEDVAARAADWFSRYLHGAP